MKWKPFKRGDFIKKLRVLGFEFAYSGAKHRFMILKQCRMTIPSNAEHSVPQLRMMLREVKEIIERKISIEEWIGLP